MENERHVSLAVGHPGKHAAFYIDTDKHKIVCEDCEMDMTPEFAEIRDQITEQLKQL